MIMPNFSRALAAYFAGPPHRAQNEFADRCGIHRSKICRLLKDTISCERDDLDRILGAIPEAKVRQALVVAYIKDHASPGALLHLKANPAGQWEGFDFSPLTPKGRAALQAILSGSHVRAFEKMLLSLAEVL